jgi:restriction endonuclease Mrr
MIPNRSETIPVIRDLLADGKTLTSDEMAEGVASHFHLTENERAQMRGPHPEYRNETAWALVELQRDGQIEKPDPKRMAYRLTDAGRLAGRNS